MSLTKNLQLQAKTATKVITLTGFFNGTTDKPQFDVYEVKASFDNDHNTLTIFYGNVQGNINEFNNGTDKKIEIPVTMESQSSNWDTSQNVCDVVFINDNDYAEVMNGLGQPNQKDKDVLSIAWY